MLKWKQAPSRKNAVIADTSEGTLAVIGNYYFGSGTTLYTVTLDSKHVASNIRNFIEATRVAEAHLTMVKEGKKG